MSKNKLMLLTVFAFMFLNTNCADMSPISMDEYGAAITLAQMSTSMVHTSGVIIYPNPLRKTTYNPIIDNLIKDQLTAIGITDGYTARDKKAIFDKTKGMICTSPMTSLDKIFYSECYNHFKDRILYQ